MNRLVYLVMTSLNPFGKLYVITAPRHEAVEAQSHCSGFLPPANAHLCKRAAPPLLPAPRQAATIISTPCCSAFEPAFHTCHLQIKLKHQHSFQLTSHRSNTSSFELVFLLSVFFHKHAFRESGGSGSKLLLFFLEFIVFKHGSAFFFTAQG